MTRFEFELTRRVNEAIAHLEERILSGNLSQEEYLKETAERAAYKRVLGEFFGDAITAMNQE